jgi:hypothetical protein
MRWILLVTFFATLCAGADVTGRWTGTARFKEGGSAKQSAIHMTLVQHGADVSGSVFVDDKDWPVTGGRSDDSGHLRFRVAVPNDTVQFDLTVAGDRMTGKAASADKADQAAAEVELTRKAFARPAIDSSGVWSGTMNGKGESLPLTIEFHQTGNQVLGVATAKGRSVALQGEIDGPKLTFRTEQGSEKVRFLLIAAADTITGFAAVEGHGDGAVLDVDLTRTAKMAAASSGDVSGHWVGTLDVEEQGKVKQYTIRFRLAQSGSSLSGAVVNEENAEFPFQGGSVQGNRIEFELDAKGEHVRFRFVLDGNKLSGESVQSRGGTETSARISAVRGAE